MFVIDNYYCNEFLKEQIINKNTQQLKKKRTPQLINTLKKIRFL